MQLRALATGAFRKLHIAIAGIFCGRQPETYRGLVAACLLRVDHLLEHGTYALVTALAECCRRKRHSIGSRAQSRRTRLLENHFSLGESYSLRFHANVRLSMKIDLFLSRTGAWSYVWRICVLDCTQKPLTRNASDNSRTGGSATDRRVLPGTSLV